jgi:hypothetical protein
MAVLVPHMEPLVLVRLVVLLVQVTMVLQVLFALTVLKLLAFELVVLCMEVSFEVVLVQVVVELL